ncbi:hypothetical protein SAY87_024658 [Trapa incisa]|uniref:Protein kinase domain-containing protein n=1 Tax=Trapa incisa TaxID=236973 RepID=A0AAN7JFX9_9MYRT|nr:hypothetical protein SAY87_024658 [Trapa incisa]
MGCFCSKEALVEEAIEKEPAVKENHSSVQLVAPSRVCQDGSSRSVQKVPSQASAGSFHNPSSHNNHRQNSKGSAAERSQSSQRQTAEAIFMARNGEGQPDSLTSSLVRLPNSIEEEEIVAGWPSWLTSVAAEVIRGLVPRCPHSFKKLKVIGRGTYSYVYKAHDLETGRTVAMKKVRFSKMDPESVRFMAREIQILRKLDHPNIIQLEGIVASRVSSSLYLIFEYMDHDLAGILARPDIKLSESQRFADQVLHAAIVLWTGTLPWPRDGVLKIGDWGLANFYQQQTLTSRVVTLWYRAPELLLGATKYGVGVDLWSAGCILAESFAGAPLLPGRTEVEQLHKILKLCGSPSEDYWQKMRPARVTSFKPHIQYQRCIAEKFKGVPSTALSLIEKLLSLEPRDRGSAAAALRSEFFTTKPFPCDPSNMPEFPPSKEIDKYRREDAIRGKAESVKGRGPESVRQGSRDAKEVPTPEFNDCREVSLQGQPDTERISHTFDHREHSGSRFSVRPPARARTKDFAHSSSIIYMGSGDSSTRPRCDGEIRTQTSRKDQTTVDLSTGSSLVDRSSSSRDASSTVYVPNKNRIHYSGPLVSPGGNIDDMLKEHERQIQQAVRNARVDRNRNRTHETNGCRR